VTSRSSRKAIGVCSPAEPSAEPVISPILTGMPAPTGFAHSKRKNGEVVITHHGRQAAVLRGTRAEKFLARLASEDDQELMARFTGNYKRGNERG
jgi:hypothetical protein